MDGNLHVYIFFYPYLPICLSIHASVVPTCMKQERLTHVIWHTWSQFWWFHPKLGASIFANVYSLNPQPSDACVNHIVDGRIPIFWSWIVARSQLDTFNGDFARFSRRFKVKSVETSNIICIYIIYNIYIIYIIYIYIIYLIKILLADDLGTRDSDDIRTRFFF